MSGCVEQPGKLGPPSEPEMPKVKVGIDIPNRDKFTVNKPKSLDKKVVDFEQ